MAYGAKYRCEFKDYYGVDVKVDILQEDYASTVTSLDPTDNPLVIEWKGDRTDIYKPIRGAVATFTCYAGSAQQFDDFFDAYEKEYKMEVYYNSSLYWTGWVMVGEHVEEIAYPPYMVTFNAYDLGTLKNVYYDQSLEDNDTMLDVIQHCLAQTGFSFALKERVNVYDDSMSAVTGTSPFSQTLIKQTSFFDDDWAPVTYYEALRRILLSFNAMLFQENGVWNIIRIPEMRATHYYRNINTSGSVTSSGTEFPIEGDFDFIAGTPVMMGFPSWKNVNIYFDHQQKNLINNGHFTYDDAGAVADFWTVTSGTASIISTAGRSAGSHSGTLYLTGSTLDIKHTKEYSVYTGDNVVLNVKMRLKADFTGGATDEATPYIIIRIDGSSYYWLDWDSGDWSATSGVSQVSLTRDTWEEFEIRSLDIPLDGDLELIIFFTTAADFPASSSNQRLYIDYIEIIPENGGRASQDLTEEINADNILDPEDITIYYGDSNNDETGASVFKGTLQENVSPGYTDAWQSRLGSAPKTLQELCVDCYKAQHATNTRRLQGVLLEGGMDYEDAVYYDSRYFVASNVRKNFAACTLDGEWIEIKQGWGDSITGTFVNGAYASNLYDTFSTSSNEFTIEKTTSGDTDYTTLNSTSVTAGTLYKVTANITDNTPMQTSDLPDVMEFAGEGLSPVAWGENVWYIVADSTTSTHYQFTEHGSGTLCEITMAVTIQEAYGL